MPFLDFFPNNEINPARKLRIRRAVEYGATWAKDWTKSVTHIIVDKDLEMKDVLKHLKMDSIPVRPEY